MFMAYLITFSLFASCIAFAMYGMNLCKAADEQTIDQ